MNRSSSFTLASALSLAALVSPSPAHAIDDAHKAQGQKIADKAVEFLRAKQDKDTGGWSIPQKDDKGQAKPHLPGITALVLRGLVMDPRLSHDDPAVTRAVSYILSFKQPDGGIYDKILPSYNTSLSLSALAKINKPEAVAAVKPTLAFMRKLQWGEEADHSVGGAEAAQQIKKDHPFYGGVGYGKHGRPDNSNLNMFMQGLQDAGVPASDPAVQRALVFLARTQMLDDSNDQPYADGSRQGGFIYATSPDAESVDKKVGQSQAGTIEETLSDGSTGSRLRCYGSMTYAGFKSYAYAELAHDDPRVTAALNWIRGHYTLDENPGMGSEGQYYYYMTFARALASWGEPVLQVDMGDKTDKRDWANDLIDKLTTLQNDDGSFKPFKDRWMESDPVLITAYSLIAVREAVNSGAKTASSSTPAPKPAAH